MQIEGYLLFVIFVSILNRLSVLSGISPLKFTLRHDSAPGIVDQAKTFLLYQKRAEEGDAEAQFALGMKVGVKKIYSSYEILK